MQKFSATQSITSSHHSQSMSVSQSPDSVTAAVDNNNTTGDENIAAVSTAPVGGGINNQAQSHNPQRPITSTTQANHNSAVGVVNPYLKESPNSSNNVPKAVVDPILRKKQQFVDKYHLQSLQHCQRAGHPGNSISSISALELCRSTHNWRNSWRNHQQEYQQQQLPYSSNASQLSIMLPLRPRLFLFRHHEHIERIQKNTHGGQNRIQTEPSRHEGVWELGTGITEISGEGGSGKTQICLSLCVTCVMTPVLYPTPSINNGKEPTAENGAAMATANTHRIQQNNSNNHYTAIYITMGEGIPSISIARRLEQMVSTRLSKSRNSNSYNSNSNDREVKDMLSRIGLLSIRNEEEFVEFVEQDLPNILEHHQQQATRHRQQHQPRRKIGIIAFDGIAGFFRFSDPLYQSQHSRNSMFHYQRSSKLLQISSQLRKLSCMYDVPIVITNQVTASIPSSSLESGVSSSGGFNMSSAPVPALGLIWSNCVSTRYILQRKDGMIATITDSAENENNVANNSDLNVPNNRSSSRTKKKDLRLRKARILQSVDMPENGREVWFVIDTGEVLAVS